MPIDDDDDDDGIVIVLVVAVMVVTAAGVVMEEEGGGGMALVRAVFRVEVVVKVEGESQWWRLKLTELILICSCSSKLSEDQFEPIPILQIKKLGHKEY